MWVAPTFAVLQICMYVVCTNVFIFSSGHCNLANYSQSQVLLDSNMVLQGKVKTRDFAQKHQKGLFLSAYYKSYSDDRIRPNPNMFGSENLEFIGISNLGPF